MCPADRIVPEPLDPLETMSAALMQNPMTALRALELRSRSLALEAQMAECVDLLQCPDVAIVDLGQSVEQVLAAKRAAHPVSIAVPPADRREGFFYPSRELFVSGDGCSFTCLATAIEFREAREGEARDPAPESDSRPIDYAAITCEARPFPVLGFVQSEESESAYPLLLRAISTLVELADPRRLELIENEVYRGLMGSVPLFDLALVLWDDDCEDDPRRPLCELSRDLAEVLKRAFRSDARFPPVLNDIVCLRMNPKRFDARLRFVWRV